jgi:LAO/AO transport system ATPase
MAEIDALLERFRTGDRLALSRLLSLVARGLNLRECAAALPRSPVSGLVVAVTGSGGVGKSTLVGKLIEHIRNQGKKVAVLACDPESPRSGGALLGDRFRMPTRPEDDGVFIRSLAATAGHGALAEHVGAMVRLLEAFGFDVVLIETVGAGQGDTAVRELADVVVLLLQPETGDDLQWEKAGVLEVADVVVVHKADLPGAEQTAAQVRNSLTLAGGPEIPVMRVSARTGLGIQELWQAVTCAPRHRFHSSGNSDLLRHAQDALAERFAAAVDNCKADLDHLADDCRGGLLSPEEAGAAVLDILVRKFSDFPFPLSFRPEVQ